MELDIFQPEMIHAACRDCVFASYDGDTQIDCLAGELALHLKNPHVKVEECTDNVKNFYVINGSACRFQRNEEWAKQKGLTNDFDSTRFYAAKEEVDAARLKVALVVIVEDTDQDSIEQDVADINEGDVVPVEVAFLLPNNSLKLKAALVTTLRDHAKFKWTVLEPKDDKAILSLIDTAVAKFEAQYYCVVTNDWIMKDIAATLDKAIRVNGDRFLALWPVDGTYSFMTAQVFAHKYFGRNAEVTTKPEYGEVQNLTTIVEKLAFIAKDVGKEYLVKDAKEVFPWLQS